MISGGKNIRLKPTTGSSTRDGMTQKAITEAAALNDDKIIDALGYTPATKVNGKVPVSELPAALTPGMIVGELGDSEDLAVSQKVTSEKIKKGYVGGENLLFNKTGFYAKDFIFYEYEDYETTDFIVAENYLIENLSLRGNFSIAGIVFWTKNFEPIDFIGGVNEQIHISTLEYPDKTAYFTISKGINTDFSADIIKYNILGVGLKHIAETAISNKNTLFKDTNTPISVLEKRTGYYIDINGVVQGGGIFPSYYLNISTVVQGTKIKILGTGAGSISAVGFYSDLQLTNLVAKYGGDGENDIKVIVPDGALYCAACCLSDYVVGLYTYEENTFDVVEKLKIDIDDIKDSFESKIKTIENTIYDDTNTPISVLEKRTGYYIDINGVVQGGGIFPSYYLNISTVIQGTKIKILGTGAGSISAVGFYSDLQLTNLVAKYGGDGENDIKVIVPDGALYCAACCLPDYVVGLYTYEENTFDVVEKLKNDIDTLMTPEKKTVVCWGDSLTAGAGGNGTSYPGVLQTLLGAGYNVLNAGVGGETTGTIGARQGGTPFVVQTDFTLPATTDYTTIALYNTWGLETLPLRQGGSATINPCYIDNIPCTLVWDSTNGMRIKRNTSGSSRTITAGTILFTNYMKLYRKPHAMVIWMGTNGDYTDVNDLIAQYKAMIDYSGTDNVIIVGLHFIYAGYSTVEDRINEEIAMTKAFGSKYINWRKYLSTNALFDAGLTPTSADLEEMAAGKCPPTFLTDAVHLNATAYTLLANLIYQRLL